MISKVNDYIVRAENSPEQMRKYKKLEKRNV